MADNQILRIKTISEYHRIMGLAKPQHPLISVINFESFNRLPNDESTSLVFEFYSVALKRDFYGKMKYGQQEYDFDEGILIFIAPGQVFRAEIEKGTELRHKGWMLLIHPDFLWNTQTAQTIQHYEYFDYSANEALFLSDKEETTIIEIMHNIENEYHSNIDGFSQNVIIAQLELLLTYADRFYHRQFITRKIDNHKILNRLEDVLKEYFNNGDLQKKGLPIVQHIADTLNLSPNYLSATLKILTGQSTQQHIHDKLIEKAKEKLSTSDLSISEIAYELGFEHSQSFSKLFKTKTNLSPIEFRNSFN